MEFQMIQADFDGACEPRNPGGHGTYDVVVRVDGEIVYRHGGYCGHGRHMSNNVAEYWGAIHTLTEAVKYDGIITLRGDSRMVIMQLGPDPALGRTRWKARRGLYLAVHKKAIKLVNQHRDRLRFQWIPRCDNEECDLLSKQVLINRGVQVLDRQKRSKQSQSVHSAIGGVFTDEDEEWSRLALLPS